MDYPRKQWRELPIDEDAVAGLTGKCEFPRAVAEMLVRRGIKDSTAAERFLHPRLSSLSDPFDLSGMREAVDCVWQAIDASKRITVFGDYDVDGITSTALLVRVLKRLGANVMPFLPERARDGYGMAITPLERCLETCRPDLIVTVDCGTNSVEAVAYAMQSGVDVVVTDHHEPQEPVAGAVAIVNPKLSGVNDMKSLAGVGVAFRLCHGLVKDALAKQRPEVSDLDLREWLDYVAVGTVADIVPLDGENRILVRHGLSQLNGKLSGNSGSPCWKALVDRAGIKCNVETYHIGFVIAPRLNAAGRMGSADSALELLLTEDVSEAVSGADYLERTNRERRSVEASIRNEAEKQIDAYFDEKKTFGIVVWDRGWHVGINGIVASRLTARYGRPVVVVAIDSEGVGTGSSRSVANMDVLQVLNGCSELLSSYGGHKMAAGLEIKESNLEDFRCKFNDLCAERLKGADLRAVQNVDAWLTLTELDDLLYGEMRKMEPYGLGNPEPVLGVRGVTVVGMPKTVGKSGEHLKMTVAAGGTQIDAVGFGLGEYEVPAGALDILFKLKENTFMGRRALQMHILDMRESL